MNGFLCYYKQKDITSFGALSRLRRITGVKKIGHCGTLDPMATGVLPAAFGRAAKFIEFLPDQNKSYRATFRLGIQTDTLDITGKVIMENRVCVSDSQVENCLAAFVGEQSQLPPMYSAISQDGVRLYELARKGIEVERKTRKIRIDSIDYMGCHAEHTYTIDVRCGKGTYIRSLISDIGIMLGCGAVLTALERRESNGFTLGSAVGESDVVAAVENGSFAQLLIPTDEALRVYPAVTVTEAQHFRFQNGGDLDLERLPGLQSGALHRVYAPDGSFFALGARDEENGVLVMRKLYAIPE